MSNCQAIASLNGITASCGLEAPHTGMAHHAVVGLGGIGGVGVDWISHGEARAAQRRGDKESQ